MNSKVHVLGTEYRIYLRKKADDKYLASGYDGYQCRAKRELVIKDFRGEPGYENTSEVEFEGLQGETLRHEIIHAFFDESGLNNQSMTYEGAWAKDEEMVDWFALQAPKIFEAFKEADCL